MTAPDEQDASYAQTVLLVDDNVDLLELLTNSLRYIGGFRILNAPDGVSGLETGRRRAPGLRRDRRDDAWH